MKPLATTVLLLSLVGVSVLLTAVAGLCDVSADDVLDLDALATGRVSSIFGSFLWSRYPAMPPLSAIFEWRAILIILGAFVPCWRVLSGQRRTRKLLLLAAPATGFLPFFLGELVLRGNTDLSQAGPWLATMLLGVMYGLILSVILATFELCRRSRNTSPTSLGNELPLGS